MVIHFRLDVLDFKVSVLHFKFKKPGVGRFIVSFSGDKNQVKIGPLIGSLRNKSVLSLAKAFPVCLRLWRGLGPLAEFGHNETALNPFFLGF